MHLRHPGEVLGLRLLVREVPCVRRHQLAVPGGAVESFEEQSGRSLGTASLKLHGLSLESKPSWLPVAKPYLCGGFAFGLLVLATGQPPLPEIEHLFG